MSTTGATVPTVEPFWNRIGAITRYPMQSGVLMTIGGLAILRLVSYLPFGWLLNFFVTIALYKYAFQVLRATANGFSEPPEGMSGVEDFLARDQLIVQFLFLVAGIVSFWLLGVTGGILMMIALALALPGATIALVVDQSLESGLNPARWAQVAGAIGWPYLAMVGLIYAAQMSGMFAVSMVPDFIPEFIQLVVVYFFQHYALVVCFHLAGYLILQYHAPLGFTPTAPVRLKRATDEPYQDLLDEVETHTREGRLDAAIALLKKQLHSEGGTSAVHERYRKLLKINHGGADLVAHTHSYLPILIDAKKIKAALDVVREALDADPDFVIRDPAQLTLVAHQAERMGFWQLALALTQGYHTRFVNHPDIVPNYLLAARLLSERHGQDDKALALLDGLISRFADHPQIGEVQAQRAHVATLLATAKKSPR